MLLKPNINFTLNIRPLSRCAQLRYQVVKCVCMFWRELEPSYEIERFAEVMRMMKLPGDLGEICKADFCVVRLYLKDSPPLVLRQSPPFSGFLFDDSRVLGHADYLLLFDAQRFA